MNEQILYYGAWAAILELLFWAGLGVLALRRYRKRRASHVVIRTKGDYIWNPRYWETGKEVDYSPDKLNWQSRLKDWYTQGEEE